MERPEMKKEKSVVIIGAGKTGRGFLARLMKEAGKNIVFIDKNKELVEELRSAKTYEIEFFGNCREKTVITDYRIYSWEEEDVKSLLGEAELVLVSVGGDNLEDVGKKLSELLPNKNKIYMITAENASLPAQRLKKAVGKDNVFISESTVFCTTIEKEGLNISSENYPYLQYNQELLGEKRFSITTLKPIENFENFLTRKLYTYNAASCIIAYLGWQKGYKIYSEAAADKEILAMLYENYKITNKVLCEEYGYDKKDQEEFARLSRTKFLDPAIIDTVERNARDPKRKLAPGERLLGPIRLMHKYHENAEVLERTVAAALKYHNPKEEKWENLTAGKTVEQLLIEICGLEPKEEISKNIIKYYKE